jgi:hypothetical protein
MCGFAIDRVNICPVGKIVSGNNSAAFVLGK